MKKSLILIAILSLILSGCMAQKRMTPDDWMRQAEQTEDSKVTALAQDTAPTSDNLIYEVDDPGGSPSSKKVTIEDLFDVEDVIAVKSLEDEDWGMASISTNSMTVEDFALNTDASAGDNDITDLDKLEGYDTAVYIDLGADGTIEQAADTLITATAPNIRLQVDAQAYLNIATADGGATTISQTSDGTDRINIGDGADRVDIATNTWDVTAGAVSGVTTLTTTSNITSGDSFIIGSADIEQAELEILDGATLSTTQINYLNAATGTTGTATTNLVYSASPTFTGTVVLPSNQALLGSPTFVTSILPAAAGVGTVGSVDKEIAGVYFGASGVLYGEADQSNTLTSSATGWTANLNLYAATYGSDGSVTDTELKYIDFTSSGQTQLDARCLESVLGTSIGPSLLLDGAVLKTSAILQEYHANNPSVFFLTMTDDADGAAVRATIDAYVDSTKDLTDFVEQTAWQVIYTDTNGDATELTVGAANTVLLFHGVTSAPTTGLLTDANIPASIDPDKIGTDGTANDKIEAANLNIQSVDLALTTGSYWVGVGSAAAEITGANVLKDLKDEDADIWQAVGVGCGAMIADGTNCAAVASSQINSGPNVYTSVCDGGTDGQLEFSIPMPENWDGGGANTVKVGIHWVATTVGVDAETVIWEAKVQARGHQDTVNNTWIATDTATTTYGASEAQYDTYYTEITIDAAIGGAGGDTLFVWLNKNSDTDTCAADIEVTGAKVLYTIDDLDEDD